MIMFFDDDDRMVELDDAMGGVWAELLPEDAEAVWRRLTVIAESDAFDGDPRTLDQRRADVLATMVLDWRGPDHVPHFGEVDILAECRRLSAAYPPAPAKSPKLAANRKVRRGRQRTPRRRKPV